MLKLRSACFFLLFCVAANAQTVAQRWNEVLLDAIRIDFPAPTVHARNLYHTSAAMYDAWATFDPVAGGHFYTDKSTLDNRNVDQVRNEAISYAAYRVLSHRYSQAVDPATSQSMFDNVMNELGYNPMVTSTEGNSAAAIGNRIAAQILSETLSDGSNEELGYIDNTGYVPANVPMVVDYPGLVTPDAPPLQDPNRWQPLFLNQAVTQNELQGEDLQTFIGPHWGNVTTFAMGRDNDAANADTVSWAAVDPGPAPLLGGEGHDEYVSDTVLLIEYSNALDPTKDRGAEFINISPRVTGNRPLGTHEENGHAVNPVTGLAYEDNFVRRADYGRILAEYWADGPNSETPPGHWNVIANEIGNHPSLSRQIGGSGEVVPKLEWDVKLYLTLNGATHDAAVAGWGTKAKYDYVRPITKIRYQGMLGQSTNAELPSYHPDGLPLEDGSIELITADSIAEGGKHRNVYENANRDADGNFLALFTEEELIGRIAIHAWNHEPENPETDLSGTDWILAENWVPYQDDNFVTPSFAAYVSGHSTFSRAAAEILASFTGSEFFPGGIGGKTFDEEFLDFEDGPTEPVTLQWATYFDAADEAGISRLWGGIHVPADDFAGRVMGSKIGLDAYAFADDLFVRDGLSWCNIVSTGDVNDDGEFNTVDVELLIEALNSGEFADEVGLAADFDGVPPAFYDVTNDGFIIPRDALVLINRLNAAEIDVVSASAVPEPSSGFAGLVGVSLGVRVRTEGWRTSLDAWQGSEL